MDRRLLVVVAAVLAGIGGVAWFVRQPAPFAVAGAPANGESVPVTAGGTAATPAPPARTAISPAAPDAPDREPPLRRMENRFIADPLAADWAQRNEKVVADFLAADNLRSLNLVVPLQQRVECRSTMCRISVLLPDIDAATQVHERLVLSIGEALPMAQTFTQVHDDGRVELITFAGDERLLAR